jgi:hypothetical protein
MCQEFVKTRGARGWNLDRSAGVFHIRLAPPDGVPHADREQRFTGRPINRRHKSPTSDAVDHDAR